MTDSVAGRQRRSAQPFSEATRRDLSYCCQKLLLCLRPVGRDTVSERNVGCVPQMFAQQQEEADEEASRPVAGFGSPVKYSVSPVMSVSIAGAISERSAMDGVEEADAEDGEVCSASPAGRSQGLKSGLPGLAAKPLPPPEALCCDCWRK